jgi:hypothetical protein
VLKGWVSEGLYKGLSGGRGGLKREKEGERWVGFFFSWRAALAAFGAVPFFFFRDVPKRTKKKEGRAYVFGVVRVAWSVSRTSKRRRREFLSLALLSLFVPKRRYGGREATAEETKGEKTGPCSFLSLSQRRARWMGARQGVSAQTAGAELVWRGISLGGGGGRRWGCVWLLSSSEDTNEEKKKSESVCAPRDNTPRAPKKTGASGGVASGAQNQISRARLGACGVSKKRIQRTNLCVWVVVSCVRQGRRGGSKRRVGGDGASAG